MLFLCFVIASTAALSDTEQSTSGDKSPAIITESGNVNINYNETKEKEDDKELVQEVTSSFFNDYLKYLNKEFSAEDDKSGFSQPTPRNPDGSIDLSKITSAPAYGVSKQTLAEYLYTKDQIDQSFAQKIDRMLLEAMQDDPDLGGLPFDPIIMAQDIPNSVDYDEAEINNKNAKITVYPIFGEGNYTSKSPIQVNLHKLGKTWRITDIIDLDPPR